MTQHHTPKVLILGAAGFLGSHIVADCLSRDWTTYAARRKSTDTWRLSITDKNNQSTPVEIDLLNKADFETAIKSIKPDIVINCTAYGVNPSNNNPELSFHINTQAPLECLYAIAEHHPSARFIHLGSCFEYGNKDHAIKENEALEPTAYYGATKAAASILLLQQAHSLDIDFCLLRVFGIWGELENPYRLIPQVISACQESQALELTECDQIRDYTYVTDMAKYILDIAELSNNFPRHEAINLGSGCAVTLKDFVLSVANIFEKSDLMKFGEKPYRENEMHQLLADTQKLNDLIGPQTKTPLETGVKATMEYLNRE